MKKFLTVLLTLIMSIGVCCGFTGCSVSTEKPTPAPTPDDVTSGGDIVLTTCLLDGTYETLIMTSWASAYQAKLKAEGKVNEAGDPIVGFDFKKGSQVMGATSEIKKFASAGNLPDIIWAGGDQHSPYSQEYFVDLRSMPGATEFFDGFYDEIIDTTHVSSIDQGIWFVPRDYNALMVYYNKTLFEDAKVALPQNGWTWEQFEATCAQLAASGKCAKPIENDIGWSPFTYTMMQNYGSDYFDSNGAFVLDSAATKSCYNALQDFNTKYVEQGTGGNFGQYAANTPNSNFAMYINVRPALPEIASVAAASGWELGCVSFPNMKQSNGANGYVGVGCSGYAINKGISDEKKQAAWDFLKFCMSEEGYSAVAKWGVLVPAIESLKESDVWYNYEAKDTQGNVKFTITGDAFVKTDATPIFLNFYNDIAVTKHADIQKFTPQFWGETKSGGGTYANAMKSLKQSLKDVCGIE